MTFGKSKINKVVLIVALGIFISLASWGLPLTRSMFTEFLYDLDTFPDRNEINIRELNNAISQLDNALAEIKERDLAQEIAAAVHELNLEDLQNNVDEAEQSAHKALSKINCSKMGASIAISLAKVDKDEINEQVRIATQNIQPQIQQSLEDAKLKLEKARQELKNVKESSKNKSS